MAQFARKKKVARSKAFFSKIGFSFNDTQDTDLDGHRWNVLYMDTSKMQQH